MQNAESHTDTSVFYSEIRKPKFGTVLVLTLVGLLFSTALQAAETPLDANLHDVILVEEGRIYFDSGYNQGVREGMYFLLYRIGADGKLVKLARMRVTATYADVSQAALADEDRGVDVRVGDRVEILPVAPLTPRLKPLGSGEASKPRFSPWSWAAVGAGLVSGIVALHFQGEMNSAYESYLASSNPSEIANWRDTTEGHLTRYRIWGGAAIGLFGFAAYQLFLNPPSSTPDKVGSISISYIPLQVSYRF